MSGTRVGAFIASNIQRFIFRLVFSDHKAIFTYYYKTNKWGDGESNSGPGSSLLATENIRHELPILIQELDIKTIFDAPCGDFNWLKEVELPSYVKYTGGELVDEIVDINRDLFENSQRSFMKFDIIENEIPLTDLWLCRDSLFHLSNSDVLKVLSNLRSRKIKYFLSTTFPSLDINEDILTGEYRPINLEKIPFNLPSPLRYIDDSNNEIIGKKLGLWEL
ncbi:MAG TPA: hypothetical protein VMV47_06075 [Bacteroidales bacterium]|nr:hypothetical protein [Bacteroidales bacterium]